MENTTTLTLFMSAQSFIDELLTNFAKHALGNVSYVLNPSLLILVTIWLMFEGYRIINGQSREPFTVFIWKAAKVVLVIFIVTWIMSNSQDIIHWINVNIKNNIASIILTERGQEKLVGGPEGVVASALTMMHILMNFFGSMQTSGEALNTDPTKFILLGGAGIGTPAVIGGALLLFNKACLALCIFMSPVFFLCLIFDSSKPMFQTWLKFFLGTLCILAVLTVMITICLKGVIYYASNIMAEYLLDSLEGVGGLGSLLGGKSSKPPLAQTTMLQGGLGLLMSTLIIGVPPIISHMLGSMC